jgi:hypothetical protein
MALMSSRERMLAALRHQALDYIPLYFNSFGFNPPEKLRWSNQVEEAETWLPDWRGPAFVRSAELHALSSDNQIRNLLDPVSPQQLPPIYQHVFQALDKAGVLARYRSHAHQLLVAWL